MKRGILQARRPVAACLNSLLFFCLIGSPSPRVPVDPSGLSGETARRGSFEVVKLAGRYICTGGRRDEDHVRGARGAIMWGGGGSS